MSLICKLCRLEFNSTHFTCFPALTFVRWRKPRHLPKAKSKEFIVRTPTPRDQEETFEMQRRFNHYRTEMKLIRSHLDQVTTDLKIQSMRTEQTKRFEQEKKDWQRMFDENDKWNARVRLIRETRQAEESLARRTEIDRIKEVQEKRASHRHDEASRRIAYEKKQAEHFITPDNVDTEVERVLDSHGNYDFAIDFQGNPVGVETPMSGDAVVSSLEDTVPDITAPSSDLPPDSPAT